MNKTISKIQSQDTYHLLKIQSVLMKCIYNYFNDNGIQYLLPVILSPETDLLQNDVFECHIEYYNQKLNLMKSMIIQKQIALLNPNIDSIYTVSPCIRLEKRDKFIEGRHAIEFQQLDFEFKNKGYKYVINFVENLIIYIFKAVVENCDEQLKYFKRTIKIPDQPFLIYDNHKCINEIGEDYEMILSKQNESPFWVLNFDRWLYDKRDISTKKNINYDIILPEGFCELGSGGEREIEKTSIISKMKEMNIDLTQHQSYLNMLNYNFNSSAGIGLGIQRFLKFFTGKYDISEVMPFERPVNGEIFI